MSVTLSMKSLTVKSDETNAPQIVAQVAGRLVAERKRIGMNQTDFAAVGGVTRRTQSKYETAELSPGADYLCALANVGVDLLFVLTGRVERRATDPALGMSEESLAFAPLSPLERRLLSQYRALSTDDQAVLQRVAEGLATRG